MFKKTALAPPGPMEISAIPPPEGDTGSNRPPTDPPGDSCPGCSAKTAMEACWKIKDKLPEKKLGFYWVHPGCSKSPLRVFCDFKTKWE